jgi:AraC family transcriptional activator of mtrCDE
MGLAGGSDLFTSLGEPLVVRFDGAEGLRDQFVMLLAESAQSGAGSRVLTEALFKQCLVLALRRWIELDASPLPWLAGGADTRLSRALHAAFERPAAAFTGSKSDVSRMPNLADAQRWSNCIYSE